MAGKAAATHHLDWITELVTGKSSQGLNLVAGDSLSILAPRGSTKSTWIAMWVAWVIGHNPSIQIIYVSYSESVALSRSQATRLKCSYREFFLQLPKLQLHQIGDCDYLLIMRCTLH
ncbi:hypothetical protein LC653_41460 [Nostoc sp. CHAB 5784]|uniref:hypothetical protein n=1 Tax=Nostoc mirabile TaxID=2907820 RepID=UPI001E2B5A12|nr:hypothetical protein [Nostoc mirabile]MCC5670093.1 hypothetical protein [Nostoc mirabile CHAB5784]